MPDSLLPHNASGQERELERVTGPALAPAFLLQSLWSPQGCPEELLPWLAWAFSVDNWDPNWAEADKRDVIAGSVDVHRHKGTVGAVKNALTTSGYGDAAVIERFGWDFHNGAAQHDGSITYSPPDHWAEYRVRLARPITIEQAAQVRAILENVAPARSHLKVLDFTEALNTYNAAISHDAAFTHGVA